MKNGTYHKVYQRIPSLHGKELDQNLQYLDQEHDLLASIFNLLQEAIVLTNTTGDIEFYNLAAQRLLGLPKDYHKATPLWHWIPLLKPLFTKPKSIVPDVIAKETELTYPEKRWVRLHMQYFQANPTRHQFIFLLRDITQEHQASEEQRLQERFDAITQLASEVAHELGNPLNSIHIHLQLLKRSLQTNKPSPSARKSIQVCLDEIQRLNEIIQHFLQAVRPQAVQLQEGLVTSILNAVLAVLKPQLDDLNISVELNMPKALPSIELDKPRLQQVFFNVLKNSIEAIGSNGWIRITGQQDGRYLTLAFADSGCGISGAQTTQMLSHTPESYKPNGHGIGMLIIRRIMQEHNGWVEIESKEHTGSILYLKFPLLNPSFFKLDTRNDNPSDAP